MANRFLSEPDPTTAWAKAAIEGRLFTAGDLVKHAAERHLRDIRDGERRGLFWRPDAAAHALASFCAAAAHAFAAASSPYAAAAAAAAGGGRSSGSSAEGGAGGVAPLGSGSTRSSTWSTMRRVES